MKFIRMEGNASSSLILVPPALNLAYGPLLGPAMLIGAGRRAGHTVDLLDLNSAWCREHAPDRVSLTPRTFVGDHDRPAWLDSVAGAFFCVNELRPWACTHDEILARASRMANGAYGHWANRKLSEISHSPDVLGVSIMYRGQVEPAIAAVQMARRRWPNLLVVAGGSHITALRESIGQDPAYGAGVFDAFVFGYAEQTWVDLLNCVADGKPWPDEVCRVGSPWRQAKPDTTVIPCFDGLNRFDSRRLTLPLQASRGCAYGQCKFCTYPAIEGTPSHIPDDALERAIEQAAARNAAISFKDSLLLPHRMEMIGNIIRGRTKWSACTKLSRSLNWKFLGHLADNGLHTLEVGLETIDPFAQNQANKRQDWDMAKWFLEGTDMAGIAVVVNYMTGFPHSDPISEMSFMEKVKEELDKRLTLSSRLEHHDFELERLSPMGTTPADFGIKITKAKPWSSILEWEPCYCSSPSIHA